MEPRRTFAWRIRSSARLAAALCALGLGACQQVQIRAVVHDRPPISMKAVETGSVELQRAQPRQQQLKASFAQDAPAIARAFEQRDRVSVALATATLSEISGDRPLRPDPIMGPIDLGYALLMDLGAGDAPYADGVETIHAAEATRDDFSDTIIRLQWRESIRPGWSITGGASLFREQGMGIIDGLGNARFGWATLGIAGRF